MKKILISLLFLSTLFQPVAHAFDFLDAGLPDRLFVLGVRAGVNTSNLSDNYSSSIQDMRWTHNQWKAGMSMGLVCDINIRNFLTLQPGFFFQRRNHDYKYMLTNDNADYITYYEGNRSSTYFQIPILASVRTKINEYIQWQVDFGPYFLYGLGGDDKYECLSIQMLSELERVQSFTNKKDYFGDDGAVKDYDWGFKIGTGLVILEHYYVGVHYEAGCRNVFKAVEDSRKKYSGYNKAWQFTVGYNF